MGPSADGSPGSNGTESPDETASPTPTDEPGTEGPFPDAPCPSFTETDRTVCSHTFSADAPVVLEPETTEFVTVQNDDTVETLGLTLTNRSDLPFGLNPYAWQLHRRDDGNWERVAPDEWIEPWYTVEPGETYEWIFATETHPTPEGDGVIHVMEDVGSGTYAFAVHGILEETGEDDGSEQRDSIECVALFDVAVAVEDSWPSNASEE